MPFALSGLVLGACLGAFVAWRRKGKLADILQYAAVYAILLALVGLVLALVIFRIAG